MNTTHSRQRVLTFSLTAMLVLSGCHKKAVPPPPPPPPPAPAPTASITASPSAIRSGDSSTLTWTTSNATQVTITGLGTVPASGSRSVMPGRSTDYTVTASGAAGASVQASTRVTVTLPPPPPPPAPPSMTEEEFFAKNVHDIYFNYDRFNLRPEDMSNVDADAAFLKSHPQMKILIEGHCDDRGSEEYNLALGESRAGSLKKALLDRGLDASRIKVISFGSEKPFCTEDTDACWQQNRRDHLKLDR